ncbi:MAG TPA: hypothetical protein VE326_11305 [Candidatus Binatia bacterium]|nr:hypothetical protein [Candidatus Binatia bacterium]
MSEHHHVVAMAFFGLLGLAVGTFSQQALHSDTPTAIGLWLACGLMLVVGLGASLVFWRLMEPSRPRDDNQED